MDNYEGGEVGGAVAAKTIVLEIEERGQARGPQMGLRRFTVQPWFSTLDVKGRKMFLESLDLAVFHVVFRSRLHPFCQGDGGGGMEGGRLANVSRSLI